MKDIRKYVYFDPERDALTLRYKEDEIDKDVRQTPCDGTYKLKVVQTSEYYYFYLNKIN